MVSVKEEVPMLTLRDFMDRPDGWGREQGRGVYQRLLRAVEASAGSLIIRISMKGVQRVDISFASETIVELARRYRGTKGICLVDLTDDDMIENIDAAASKKGQPLLLWQGKSARVLGAQPTEGCREAFDFALKRTQARAAEFVQAKRTMSIANASMKFKQLWEQGFLLRRESAADSGGVEFVYQRIE
jgi:hypothetical protein